MELPYFYRPCTMPEDEETKEAIVELMRKWISIGDSIYALIRHTSDDEMIIDYKLFKDGHLFQLGVGIGILLGYDWDEGKQGLIIKGSRNNGFLTVFTELSYALHGRESRNFCQEDWRDSFFDHPTPSELSFRAGNSIEIGLL